MSLQQRISDLSAEVSACKRQLEILEAEIETVRDSFEEARLRAAVSETPLADREADEVSRDLARLERVRDEVQSRLTNVNAQIDQLLDEAASL